MTTKKKPAAVDPDTGEDMPRVGVINIQPLGVLVDVFPSAWRLVFRSRDDAPLVTLAKLSAIGGRPVEFGIWRGRNEDTGRKDDSSFLMAIAIGDHPNINAAWNKAFEIACEFSVAAIMFPTDMGRPN